MKFFILFLLYFYILPIYSQLLIGKQWTHKNVISRGGSPDYTTYIEDVISLKYTFPKSKDNSYSFSVKGEVSFENYRKSKRTNVLISRYPILFQLNADGINSDLFSFTFEGGYIYSSISTGNAYDTKGSLHGYLAGLSFNFRLRNKLSAIFGYRRILDFKTSLVEPHLFGESNFFIGLETDIIDLFKDVIHKRKRKKDN